VDISFLKQSALSIQQRPEMAELIGFETRNKYEIQGAQGQPVGYAAEQSTGIVGALMRQLMGHWREFEIHIFDVHRQLLLVAHHPFRFFFQRLEVRQKDGTPIGAIQQRFALLYKKFDVVDSRGRLLCQMEAPFWRIWTFPIFKMGREVASIKKKWSGLLKEAFTDADNFRVEFADPTLDERERALVMVAALFVDLVYFERKART